MTQLPESTPQPIAAGRRPDGRRLKVCHLASSNWGCRWMVEQLRDLRDDYGYDVAAVISDGPGTLLEHLQANSIPTYQWNFGLLGRRDAPTLFGRIVHLGQLFKREQFDVIQSHLFVSMVMGRLAAWLFDVPIRISMIPHPAHLEAPVSREIDRATLWMDTALVASCEQTRHLYRSLGVKEKQLELIYYGPDASRFDPEQIAPVDLRDEYGWGPETRLIGNVAFFYWRSTKTRWDPPNLITGGFKGQEDIIRAAPLVLSEFPEARFMLIGSAPSEDGQLFLDSMKALVEQLGLKDKVVFPGYRPDTPGIIRTLDVSIQAALSENLGGTVESLLLERPMVATRAGGLVDSVRDGETGVLVEPANPASLAEGILCLLRDPQQAQQYGKAGRQLMLERFTLARTVADLDALYRKHLYTKQKRRAGYRPWLILLRAPIFMLVGLYLWVRVLLIGQLVARGKGYARAARRRIFAAVYRPG